MKIGLIDVDGKGARYPNLALMKLAAHHRRRGDRVEWVNYLDTYDIVYKSKVFNFSADDQTAINAAEVVCGGTGYDLHKELPEEIDALQPDYSIYPGVDAKTAYGFLTRGCPNRCKWCVVPKKEGLIRPYMDVEEIAVGGRKRLILMDNNVLASDYGLRQIEKIVRLGYYVDFNQAMDARLVTDDIAKLLAQVRWIKRIRFGCDTPQQISDCDRAIELIDKHGYKGEYFLYCIIMDDMVEALTRLNHWRKKGGRYLPHAQPFRDLDNPRQVIPQWQRDMAHWADRKALFQACKFVDFEPRKGFVCADYFKTE